MPGVRPRHSILGFLVLSFLVTRQSIAHAAGIDQPHTQPQCGLAGFGFIHHQAHLLLVILKFPFFSI